MKQFAIVLLILALLTNSTLAGPILPMRIAKFGLRNDIGSTVGNSSSEFQHPSTTKRAFFRTLLKDRLDRERRGDRKRLLRRVLADDDLQTIALAYADYLRRLEFGGQGLEEEDADGKFFRLFQWMIENQDAIIAFLEKIISLFEGISPETVSFAQPEGTTNNSNITNCRLMRKRFTTLSTFV